MCLLDLREAYKILGLSEEATNDELEKQYMLWIKRYHAHQHEQNAEKPFDMDMITLAYNTVKHVNEYGSTTKVENRSFSHQFQHFLHYYKLHIVGVIILLIFVGSIIQTLVSNHQEKKELASLPPEDLGIMLYGDFFPLGSEVTPVSTNVLAAFPSWKRVTTQSNYAPTEISDTMDAGNQQKSVLTLMSDQSDVYIMGEANFEQLMKLEVFQPLGTTLKGKVQGENLIYGKSPADESEQIYGVVINDNTIFEGLEVKDTKKIAAIRADADNKDNALNLLIELTK